jgi:1,4-alpha-glucan branching enzyme
MGTSVATVESASQASSRIHHMPFGAEILDGAVRFQLFAPAAAARIELAIEGEPATMPLRKLEEGWQELVTPQAHAGTRYQFILPDGTRVPDPASRYQPQDVHGPSEVVDVESYAWSDTEWHGRAWSEAVLYELHVGTFTEEGTFRAAIKKLDHLSELGVTAIEQRERIPNPGSEESFRNSKLDLHELSQPEHAQWFDWYKQILAGRRKQILHCLIKSEAAPVNTVCWGKARCSSPGEWLTACGSR